MTTDDLRLPFEVTLDFVGALCQEPHHQVYLFDLAFCDHFFLAAKKKREREKKSQRKEARTRRKHVRHIRKAGDKVNAIE